MTTRFNTFEKREKSLADQQPGAALSRLVHVAVISAGLLCTPGAMAQSSPGTIGLADAESNTVLETNQAGQALGYAFYYNGSTPKIASWLYSQGSTREIGLTGYGYSNIDGAAFSLPKDLNQAGQAVGHSIRYAGISELGQTAWFYDSGLDQTFSLEFSTAYFETLDWTGSPSSYSWAYSRISYLGEDGLVLGTYADVSSDGHPLQVFAWTVDGGKQNIGPQIDVSAIPFRDQYPQSSLENPDPLDLKYVNDWEAIAQRYRASVMAPVPEPETWAMLLAGLAVTTRMVGQRRRREKAEAGL